MLGDNLIKDWGKEIIGILEKNDYKNIIYSDDELFAYLDRAKISEFDELNKVEINTFANFKRDENIDMLKFF